jgi:hypothetical protein
MHPYLARLGVRSEVQAFFAPYYSDGSCDLLFQLDNYREHFGFAFHRIPSGGDFWLAGELNLFLVDRGFISNSAMDAIAFLHFFGHTLPNWENMLFIAIGLKPSEMQLRWIRDKLAGKQVTLLFPADLPGNVTDLKVAAAFRRLPAAAFLAEKERLKICFRAKVYEFDQQTFTLSAFERASTHRFKVVTCKPKHGASFLEQLKAGAFPSH